MFRSLPHAFKKAALPLVLIGHFHPLQAAETGPDPSRGLPQQVSQSLFELKPLESSGRRTAFANNVNSRFSFELAPGIVAFTLGADSHLAVRMVGLGRDDQGTAYQPGPLAYQGASAVTLDRAARLREEWANTSEGLKHSFIIDRRPDGHGPLRCLGDVSSATCRMSAEGDLEFVQDGSSTLEYRALKVWDAAGTTLPARFELRQGGFSIVVDDAAAVYPVTVDPLFSRSKNFTLEGAAVTLAMDEDVLLVGVPGWNVKPGSDLESVIAGAGGELGTAAPDDRLAIAKAWANFLKGTLTEMGFIDNTIYGVGAVFSYQNINGRWEFRDVLQRWADAERYTGRNPADYSEEGAAFGASLAVGGGSAMIGSPGFKWTKYANTFVFGFKRLSGPHEIGTVDFFAKPYPRNQPHPFERIGLFREVTLDGGTADVWTGNGIKHYQRFGEKVAMSPSYAVVTSGRTVDGAEEFWMLGDRTLNKDPYSSCKLHYFCYKDGRWQREAIQNPAYDSGPIMAVGVLGDDAKHDALYLNSPSGSGADATWGLRLKPDPWANQNSTVRVVDEVPTGGMACSMAVSGRRAVVGAPGTNRLWVYQFNDDGTSTRLELVPPPGVTAVGQAVAMNPSFILASAGANGADLVGWRLMTGGSWLADPVESADAGREVRALALNPSGGSAVLTADGANSRLSVRQVSRRLEGTVVRNGTPTSGVSLSIRHVTEVEPSYSISNNQRKDSGPWPTSQGKVFFEVPGNLGNVYSLKLVGDYEDGSSRSDTLWAQLKPPYQVVDLDGNGVLDSTDRQGPYFFGSGPVGGVDISFTALYGPDRGGIDSAGTWEAQLNDRQWQAQSLRTLKLRAEGTLPPGVTSQMVTGPDGRFRFEGLPEGSFVVTALGGPKGATAPVTLFKTIQADTTLQIEGSRGVAGWLTAGAANQGLPGITVKVSQGSKTVEAITNPQGYYRAEGFFEGPVLVTPLGGIYPFQDAPRTLGGMAQQADFKVMGTESLSIPVLRSDGSPFAGVKLRVSGPFGFSQELTSSAEGRVALTGLIAGDYQMVAADARYQWPVEPIHVALPLAAGQSVAALKSVGGGVSVRVSEADVAKPGAVVSLARIVSETVKGGNVYGTSAEISADRMQSTLRFEVEDPGRAVGGTLWLPAEETGYYHQDRLLPCERVIVTSPSGYQVVFPGRPCDQPAAFDLAGFSGLPVAGSWQVTRIYQAPVSMERYVSKNAVLTLQRVERVHEAATTGDTGSDGRKGFYDMPAGDYEVSVLATAGMAASEQPRWRGAAVKIAVSSGTVGECPVTLSRNNRVTGILRCQGRPVPLATLKLGNSQGGELTARSAADGSFVFATVASGNYQLSASDPGFTTLPAAVDLGRITSDLANRSVEAQATGVVAGRILDEQGQPVAGERLRLSPSRKSFPLAAGVQRMSHSDWDYNRFSLPVVSSARIADLRVQYQLQPRAGDISLTALESGDGYQRRMFTHPDDGRWIRQTDGYYGAVADRALEKQLYGIKWQDPVDSFEGFKGRSLAGQWNFIASHRMWGSCLLDLQQLSLDVDAWRLPADEGTRELVTDEQGRFRFTGLGPAFFQLEHLAGKRFITLPRTRVVDASLNPENILLAAREQTLHGVAKRAGTPVAGAMVSIRGDSGAVYQVVADAQGAFTFTSPLREQLRLRVIDPEWWLGNEGLWIPADFDGTQAVALDLIPREVPQFSVAVKPGLLAPLAFYPTAWFNLSGPVAGKLGFEVLPGTPFEAGNHRIGYVFEATGTDRYRAVAGTVEVALASRPLYPLFVGDPAKWSGRYPFSSENSGNLQTAALGESYGLGLRRDGSLFSWTWGVGSPVASIPANSGVIRRIAAGPNHALAIRSDGSVLAWGQDDGSGKLSATGPNAKAVAAGAAYSAVLREDGSLDLYGSLAAVAGNTSHETGPFSAICGGESVLIAIRANGSARIFGDPQHPVVRDFPESFGGIIAASVGDRHALALLTNGTVFAWGDDSRGQISGMPSALPAIRAVQAAGDGCLAIAADGRVFAWGALSAVSIPATADCSAAAVGGDFMLLLVNQRRALEADLDDDGLIDSSDPDIDGDLVANGADAFPFDPAESSDTDGDGSGNTADKDDDGDGATDGIETRLGLDPLDPAARPERTMLVGLGGTALPSISGNIVDFDASATVAVFLTEDGRAHVRGGGARLALLEQETGLVQVVAGNRFVMGLREDGTLAFFGDDLSVSYSPRGDPRGVRSIRARGNQASWVADNGTFGTLEYDPANPSYWYVSGIPPVAEAAARLAPPARLVEPLSYNLTLLRPDGSVVSDSHFPGNIQPPADLPPVRHLVGGDGMWALLEDGSLRVWGRPVTEMPGDLPPLASLESKGYGFTGLTADGALYYWGNSYYFPAPDGWPGTERKGFIKAQVLSQTRGYALRQLMHPLAITLSDAALGSLETRSDDDAAPGTVVHVKVTPARGHVFAGWTGTFIGQPAEFDWTVNEATSSVAVLARDGRDPDRDGLSNYQELLIHGTDPELADSDDDSLSDSDEIGRGTNPLSSDTDADTVADAYDLYPLDFRKAVNAVSPRGRLVAWPSYDWRTTQIPTELKQSGAVLVSASREYTLALDPAGRVFAWGYDYSGETIVPEKARSGIVRISAGYNFALALSAGGEVIAWGSNRDGACDVPEEARSGVIAIAAGDYHAVALKSNGRVVCWGGFYPTEVPASVQGRVIDIAAGGFHSMVLLTDGTVAAWGTNSFGQCNVPADLGTGIVAIATNGDTSMALNRTGKLRAWGKIGAPPTGVPAEATGFTAVSTARGQVFVTDAAGALQIWGHNIWGEGSPAGAVNGAVLSVSGGKEHSVAVLAPRTISGRLHDWAHQPLANTRVTAWSQGKSYSAVTDANGVYLLSVDVPGPISLGVDHPTLMTDGSSAWSITTTSGNVNGLDLFTRLKYKQQTLPFGLPAAIRWGETWTPPATTNAGIPIRVSVSGAGVIESGSVRAGEAGGSMLIVLEAAYDSSYKAGIWTASVPVTKRVPMIQAGASRVFNGLPQAVGLTTEPQDLPCSVRYDAVSATPVLPGEHGFTATVNTPLYEGQLRGSFRITADNATIAFAEAVGGTISRTYQESPQPAPLLTGEPPDARRAFIYQGTSYGPSSDPPTAAGAYQVRAVSGNGVSAGEATASFVINRSSRTLAWAPGENRMAPGDTPDLASRLAGNGGVPARFQVVSGPAALANELVAWGAQGTTPDWPYTPTQQLDLPEILVDQVRDVALNAGYGLLLTTGGTVVEWGGLFNYPVPDLALENVAAIFAGKTTRAAVTRDGHLVHWGGQWLIPDPYNEWGPPLDETEPPAFIQGQVQSVALAQDFGVALLKNGSVVDWGNTPNPDGWYGYDSSKIVRPDELPTITAVTASSSHILALGSNGCVYAWGNNASGGCEVPEAARSGVVSIHAGVAKSYALKADGTSVSWGHGAWSWDEATQSLSNPLVDPAGLPALSQVVVADYSILALTQDKRVIGWGRSPLNAAAIPAAAAAGPVEWLRAGPDFAAAMVAGSKLKASGTGVVRIKVSIPEDTDHLATDTILELVVGDPLVPLVVDSETTGGTISGLDPAPAGALVKLRFLPEAGRIPLAWVVDGSPLAPVPELAVTVRQGMQLGARFGAPLDDADGDGWNNLLEYALAGNPLDPASHPQGLRVSMETHPSGRKNPVLRFHSIADASLAYQVLASASPAGPWTPVDVRNGTVNGPVTVLDPAESLQPGRFYQLAITRE